MLAAAVLAVAWRLSRGSIPKALRISLAIGFISWSIQCLASDPSLAEHRAPSDTRYLYPGAAVVFLIFGDLVTGMRWPGLPFGVLVAAAVFGITCSISQMSENGEVNQIDAADVRQTVTAAGILFLTRELIIWSCLAVSQW